MPRPLPPLEEEEEEDDEEEEEEEEEEEDEEEEDSTILTSSEALLSTRCLFRPLCFPRLPLLAGLAPLLVACSFSFVWFVS